MDNPQHDSQQPASSPAAAEQPRAQQPRRRWRLCFLLLVLVGAAAWFGLRLNRVARQERMVQRIESLGGKVFYSYEGARVGEPQGDPTLRKLLGDQYFVTVMTVHIGGPKLTQADLEQLAADMQGIGPEHLFVEQVELGDSLVKPLKTLTGLKHLFVSDLSLTPAGLKELEESLPHTQVKRAP